MSMAGGVSTGLRYLLGQKEGQRMQNWDSTGNPRQSNRTVLCIIGRKEILNLGSGGGWFQIGSLIHTGERPCKRLIIIRKRKEVAIIFTTAVGSPAEKS